MLVVMPSHATTEQIRAVCDRVASLGFKAHPIPGAAHTAIGITGNNGPVDLASVDPDRALSDGQQSILPEEFQQLIREAGEIAAVLGRRIS